MTPANPALAAATGRRNGASSDHPRMTGCRARRAHALAPC